MEKRKLLLELLEKASAPVTGKKVACIIETRNKHYYGGYNTEFENPITFSHAEEKALNEIKRNKDFSRVSKVFLAGKGQEKIRQVAPCSECFALLAPYLHSKSELVIFEPDSLDSKLVFNHAELTNVYKPREYSKIIGKTIKETMTELKKKTVLKRNDLKFVAELRFFGLKNRIHFYLTGSASGRGGISQIINKKRKKNYDDLDLIAVSPESKKIIERKFTRLVSKYFTRIVKRKTKLSVHFINEIRNITYFYAGGKKIISLSIGKTLKKGMTRMDFYKKNFFHQLS